MINLYVATYLFELGGVVCSLCHHVMKLNSTVLYDEQSTLLVF